MLNIDGLDLYAGWLDTPAQRAILGDIGAVIAAAPPAAPITRWGKPMSVKMTSAGAFGWVSDRKGYRYVARQSSGAPWPPIPESVLAVWSQLCPWARAPECCLINHYSATSRMGLHQDRDEADFSQPVLSISLGDSALFRVGGSTRGGPTQSVWLNSGDVVVMGGAARRLFHGIDRVRGGSSDLVAGGGRINLTLRVVS